MCFTNLTVVNILHYIRVSNHYFIHLKHVIFQLYLNKAGKTTMSNYFSITKFNNIIVAIIIRKRRKKEKKHL